METGAAAYGNRCAAAASTNGARTESEDCLFVNVQRPTGLRRGDRRPVYVFIHGGGLVNGSSNQADMAAMVRATGVVGVTFNYRLGALGFLGLPGLTAEAGESGNYGFQDQQAALRWIRQNIAAFGGDPARVTVGGESATWRDGHHLGLRVCSPYRSGPDPDPGYVWGAGHAAELAYLFPSFDNGTPIAPTFDGGNGGSPAT